MKKSFFVKKKREKKSESSQLGRTDPAKIEKQKKLIGK